MTTSYNAICAAARFLATNAFLLKVSKHVQTPKIVRQQIRTTNPIPFANYLRSSNIDFVDKVTKAFLSPHIPPYKQNNKHIKNKFRDIGYSLPSETLMLVEK